MTGTLVFCVVFVIVIGVDNSDEAAAVVGPVDVITVALAIFVDRI